MPTGTMHSPHSALKLQEESPTMLPPLHLQWKPTIRIFSQAACPRASGLAMASRPSHYRVFWASASGGVGIPPADQCVHHDPKVEKPGQRPGERQTNMRASLLKLVPVVDPM